MPEWVCHRSSHSRRDSGFQTPLLQHTVGGPPNYGSILQKCRILTVLMPKLPKDRLTPPPHTHPQGKPGQLLLQGRPPEIKNPEAQTSHSGGY